MALFPSDDGQDGRKFGLHLVPCKVDACMVFQVPVDARGDVHPGIAAHHDLRALLVEFKEILLALHQLCLKLGRCTLVDSFQQIVNGVGKTSDE